MSSARKCDKIIPMNSGVYAIKNNNNGKMYIGSAINIAKRKKQHFSDLRHSRHVNQHLQNSFNKYGESAFAFFVLEYVIDTSDLINTEQRWINTLQLENLYNICPKANSHLGVRRTAVTRKRISKAMCRRWAGLPPEHIPPKKPEQKSQQKPRRKPNQKSKKKPVMQIDIETHEVIDIFDSVSAAARHINRSPVTIYPAVGNPQKTAHGYKWEFVPSELDGLFFFDW